MYLSPEEKEKFSKNTVSLKKTTGSAEGQIALFTYRIEHLTEHLKKIAKIIIQNVLW